MKRLSLLLVAVLAIGCKINIDQPPTSKPSDAAGATGTTGSTAGSTDTTGSGATAGSTTGASTTGSKSSTGSSSTGSKSTTGTPSKTDGKTTATGGSATSSTGSTDSTPGAEPIQTPTTEELKKKPGYNPSRLYQLSTLKTVNLTVNGHTLKTWVADTDPTREEGLMFVRDKDITPDQAMIFVFPFPKEQGFWMKNTYIPLDIAYIGSDKKVVSTATMQPFDEKNVPSHGLAKYALEMKVGTVQRLGIQKGSEINIPDSVQSQDQSQGPGGPPGGMMGGPGG